MGKKKIEVTNWHTDHEESLEYGAKLADYVAS